jgi:hypothetical protein
LYNYSAHKFSKSEEEIGNVNLKNKQFRLIQRGVDESQLSFEILIDTLLRAEQGTLQPLLITAEKIKDLSETQRLQMDWTIPTFLLLNYTK